MLKHNSFPADKRNEGSDMKIAIRVDGNKSLGMGNVYRSLSIAEMLQKRGQQVCFIMKSYPGSYEPILEKGFSVFLLSPMVCNGTLNAQLSEIIECNSINVFINDIKNTDSDYVNHLKNLGLTVVNFDDLGQGRSNADILIDAFYPSKNNGTINHHNFGPSFIILREEFRKARNHPRVIKKEISDIAIMMGAANTGNFLDRVLKTLGRIPESVKCHVILSKAVQNAGLFQIEYPNKNFFYYYQPENIADILLNADLAITGGGISMCECCTLGTPSIIIPQVPHEEKNALMFQAAGAVSAFEYDPDLSEDRLFARLHSIMTDSQQRIVISHNAKKYVDGKGMDRIMQILSPYLN